MREFGTLTVGAADRAEFDERGRRIRSDVVLELRCEVCGSAIEQRREGRPRRFCDGRCRSKARRVGVVAAIAEANAEDLQQLRVWSVLESV